MKMKQLITLQKNQVVIENDNDTTEFYSYGTLIAVLHKGGELYLTEAQ